MMAVTYATREARTLTSLENLFTGIGHEHDLAFEDVHKLVLDRVPVPLTRPGARWQHQYIHSELREPGRIAQLTPKSFPAGLIEWRRIARASRAWDLVDINLARHDRLASRGFVPATMPYMRGKRPKRIISGSRLIPH